jgi:hypothetical protein
MTRGRPSTPCAADRANHVPDAGPEQGRPLHLALPAPIDDIPAFDEEDRPR